MNDSHVSLIGRKRFVEEKYLFRYTIYEFRELHVRILLIDPLINFLK